MASPELAAESQEYALSSEVICNGLSHLTSDKHSVVEAIDSEADDHEFDDRMHWSRRPRRSRDQQSKKPTKRKVGKSQESPSQPRITTFCSPSSDSPDSQQLQPSASKAISSPDGTASDLKLASGRPKRRAVIQSELEKEDVDDVPKPKKKTKKVANRKRKDAFFMHTEDRKQLQEMEAKASLKEQMRIQREKDLAFFNGRADDSFFHAFVSMSQTPEVIDLTSSPSIWRKETPSFPCIPHTFVEEIDVAVAVPSLALPTRQIKTFKPNDTKAPLFYDKAGTCGPSEVERTQADLFWFRHDANLDMSCTYETEHDLINALAENGDIDEERVNSVYHALLDSREKRLPKAANLSLVDKYLPISSDGIIGNESAVSSLKSWLQDWTSSRKRVSDMSIFHGESEDESGITPIFVVQGLPGSGKSASVYACAEELGYQVIEINAAQCRSGKDVMSIAEATQSSRVMSNETQVKSQKSLLLFDDVDIVFEQDRGFLNAIGTLAKRTKCPLVVTCEELPPGFPTNVDMVIKHWDMPSTDEFANALMLIGFLEHLPVSMELAMTLATYMKCDLRRAMHFIETNAEQLKPQAQPKRTYCWNNRGTGEGQNVPMWTHWLERDFDLMDWSLLSTVRETYKNEKTMESVHELEDVWALIDDMGHADMWTARSEDTFEDSRCRSYAFDLRQQTLATNFKGPNVHVDVDKQMVVSSTMMNTLIVQSEKDSKRSEKDRITSSLTLPTTLSTSLHVDYLPYMGQLLSNSLQDQSKGRHRLTRRKNYLRNVLSDLYAADSVLEYNSFPQL